jgi:biopolymer transport protein ExbB
MTASKLIELANASGGTLYLMCLLMLAALTVIIERTMYLSKMQQGGDTLMALLSGGMPLPSDAVRKALSDHAKMPHVSLFEAALAEPTSSGREACASHLEEAVMREVPTLDRSLWVLDTIITLAPLLGLFGTIVGMFGAFSVLGDVQNAASQVTGGIAEALIATASGLLIAMVGLVFFNWLNTKVRLIVHQMETIKIMLLNRRFSQTNHANPTAENAGRSALKVV